MSISVGIRISILPQLVKKLTVVNAQPHVVIIHLLQGILKEDEILHLKWIALESLNVVLGIKLLSKPLGLTKLRLHNPIMLGRYSILSLGVPWTGSMFAGSRLFDRDLLKRGRLSSFPHIQELRMF